MHIDRMLLTSYIINHASWQLQATWPCIYCRCTYKLYTCTNSACSNVYSTSAWPMSVVKNERISCRVMWPGHIILHSLGWAIWGNIQLSLALHCPSFRSGQYYQPRDEYFTILLSQSLTLLVYSTRPGGRVRCMSIVITIQLGSCVWVCVCVYEGWHIVNSF